MKSLLLAVALLALFASVFCLSEEEQEFQQFQKIYSKTYNTQEEYDLRFQIFKKNLQKAQELDSRDPHASYGVTKFSDLTEEEFRANYLMPKGALQDSLKHYDNANVWEPSTHTQALPDSFNWTAKGVVTPIYNQQQCGSCWAFSTTENIESMWALAGHTLTSLSMQQIVSCDKTDGGCGGGNPPTAYQYVISAGGLEYYNDYPYTAKNGKCKFDASDIAASISNWTYITRSLDESAVQQWTFTHGPPSICVDASTWSNYKGGVITTKSLCGKALDHCVQIVGWDVKAGVNAWVVRNSWGTDWGYAGYLYVEMGHDVCGIAQEVTSSIV